MRTTLTAHTAIALFALVVRTAQAAEEPPPLSRAVVSATGAPAAGAKVTLAYGGPSDVAVTNAQGEALLAGATTRYESIEAERDGFRGSTYFSIDPFDAAPCVEITLSPERTPAPRTHVRTSFSPLSHAGVEEDDQLPTAFAELSPTEPAAAAPADDRPSAPKPCVLRGVLTGPGGERIDCRDEASYFVLLVHSAFGAWVEGCDFRHFDADGSFAVQAPPCGPGWVHARFDNFADSAPVALDLCEGAVIDGLALKLEVPRGTVYVRVTDKLGRPREGVDVVVAADTAGAAARQANPTAALPRGVWRRGASDARGIARIDFVPETRVTVSAQCASWRGRARDETWPGKDTRASMIVEVKGETAVGLVLEDAGVPTRAALRASVTPEDPDAVVGVFVVRDPATFLSDDPECVPLDPDEKPEPLAESASPLHLYDLVPRGYVLSAWSGAHCGVARVVLAPGETRDVVVPLTAWGALRAEIVIGSTPLQSGRLRLRGPLHECIEGEAGVFQDDALVPGTYRAEVCWRADYGQHELAIVLPEPVIVPEGGQAQYTASVPAGSVTLALSLRGAPLARGKACAFLHGVQAPFAELAIEEHPLAFQAWPAGAYTLQLWNAEGAFLGVLRFDVQAGATTTLACELGDLPEVRLAALLPDGRPAYTAHGTFTLDGGPFFRVEGDGRLSFRAPEGTLAGFVGTSDYDGYALGPVRITKGAPNEVVAKLQPGGFIALDWPGRFCPSPRAYPCDADGTHPGIPLAPVETAAIAALLDPADLARAIETGCGDMSRSPMLPPGRYRVTHPGWSRTLTADVLPGKVTLLRP